MSVELKINKTSNVLRMGNCPKNSEHSCGINYRAF